MTMPFFKHTPYRFWHRPKICLLSVGIVVLTVYGLGSPAQAEQRILMLGDSITAGYGLKATESLPVQLQQAVNRQFGIDQYTIVNAGVSGDTTTGGAARLDWLLVEDTDAAIVALGGNDTLRGISAAKTRASLQKILQTLKDRGIPTLLAGMQAPRNMGADYVTAFDGVFQELAQKYGVVFYPFLLDGVATIPTLNQADGIHPNPAGVARIVSGIMPYIQKLVYKMSRE